MIDARALEKLELLDPDGEPIPMGNIWQDRPVVLALVRHFG